MKSSLRVSRSKPSTKGGIAPHDAADGRTANGKQSFAKVRSAWTSGLAVSLILGWSASAAASGMGELSCLACGTWMPIGINVGGATHPGDGTGLLLGAEASWLRIRKADTPPPLYWGLNVDALYDVHASRLRLSFGPELVIWAGVGIDAAPVLEVGESIGKRLGLRLRYFAAFPFITPYVGCVQFLSGESSTVVELGLLVKFPLLLSEHS